MDGDGRAQTTSKFFGLHDRPKQHQQQQPTNLPPQTHKVAANSSSGLANPELSDDYRRWMDSTRALVQGMAEDAESVMQKALSNESHRLKATLDRLSRLSQVAEDREAELMHEKSIIKSRLMKMGEGLQGPPDSTQTSGVPPK